MEICKSGVDHKWYLIGNPMRPDGQRMFLGKRFLCLNCGKSYAEKVEYQKREFREILEKTTGEMGE